MFWNIKYFFHSLWGFSALPFPPVLPEIRGDKTEKWFHSLLASLPWPPVRCFQQDAPDLPCLHGGLAGALPSCTSRVQGGNRLIKMRLLLPGHCLGSNYLRTWRKHHCFLHSYALSMCLHCDLNTPLHLRPLLWAIFTLTPLTSVVFYQI